MDPPHRGIVGEAVAQIEVELADHRQVAEDRHQQFAEQLIGVHRTARITQDAEAQHIGGPIGLVQQAVGPEGVFVGAVVRADRKADLAGWKLEQTALDAGLHHALLQLVLVQRAARQIVYALVRRRQIAEGVPAAGAEVGPPGGAVEQPGRGAGAGAAGLFVVELGPRERGVGVPGPVPHPHIAGEAAGELIDRVAVLLLPRPQDVQGLVEGEGRAGVRARGQDGAELRRDERIARRDRQAIDIRGQGRVRDPQGLVVGEGELDEGPQAVGQVVVDLPEHGVPVQVRLDRRAVIAEVHLLRGARGVRVDDIGAVGFRIAEVLHPHAGGGEDGLIGVEPDLSGIASRRIARQGGQAILTHEDAVDGRLGGQVGAEQHRALRDGRQARRALAEDVIVARALQGAVAVGVVHRNHRPTAALVKGLAGGERNLEGLPVALLGDAILAIDDNAVEVAPQAEVHHPGRGVRAIGRRGAAGDDLDILDQRLGNGVQIDRAVRVRGLQAPPVHQDQGALGPQAAQRGVGLAAVQAGGGRAGIALAE